MHRIDEIENFQHEWIKPEPNFCPVEIELNFADLYVKECAARELSNQEIAKRNADNARFLRIWSHNND